MYPSAQMHTFLLGTYLEMKLVSHRRVTVSHNLLENVFQSGFILLHSTIHKSSWFSTLVTTLSIVRYFHFKQVDFLKLCFIFAFSSGVWINMKEWEGLELTSSHRHTSIITSYRATNSENDLKTNREDSSQLKIQRSNHKKMGRMDTDVF